MADAVNKQYPWFSGSDQSVTPLTRDEALECLKANFNPSIVYVVVFECAELIGKEDTTPSVMKNEAAALYGETIAPWHTILLGNHLMIAQIENHMRKGHTLVGYFRIDLRQEADALSQRLRTFSRLLEEHMILGQPRKHTLSKLDLI